MSRDSLPVFQPIINIWVVKGTCLRDNYLFEVLFLLVRLRWWFSQFSGSLLLWYLTFLAACFPPTSINNYIYSRYQWFLLNFIISMCGIDISSIHICLLLFRYMKKLLSSIWNLNIPGMLFTSHRTPHITIGNVQCLKLLLGTSDLKCCLWNNIIFFSTLTRLGMGKERS